MSLDAGSTSGRAVVIGAGTMGGGIAAQLANAGWRVTLLDVPGADTGDLTIRNRAAATGLDRIVAARPPLLFLPEFAARIAIGNTSDDLACMESAGWIVEAVAERMDVKQAILAEVEAHAGPNAIVSSNTSGLCLREMVRDRSAGFRSRFLGSHFLNPPRYLKLLEVAPLENTDPSILSGFIEFAEQVLGHRVVIAKDTPGFISTRIWIEHLMATMHIAVEHGLTVEEADYLTGALLGRPRSATFRMADIVGLDIVAGIANNLYGALPDDPFRSVLQPPEVIQKLVVAGRLGDKTHGGFYKREGKTILALDFVLGEYRSRNDVRIDEVERLLARPFAERLLAFEENSAEPWARFVIAVLDSLDRYVEYVGPVVASDVLSVDNVMRWGFQWEMGPYEMNDLRTGEQRSYRTRNEQRYARSFGLQEMLPIASSPEYLTLAERKTCSGTVFEDEAGALIDLGEGVACLEFRTKMNTFSPALCAVVNRARDMAERDFAALVIGGDGPHFSAGYNLKVLLDAAIAEDWAALAAMLREVQTTFQRLKYSTVPIVAAVRGYTLGAGFECAIHCSAIQAGPELVMGMPEMLVGLVPAGGGIKETLARAMDELKCQTDAIDGVEFAFRKIVLSGKSGSAHEARKMGLIRQSDGISRNADRLLFDAKSRALALAGAEYRPPEQKAIQVLGEPAWERLAMLVEEQHRAGVFTQYDKDIALKVAGVLTHKDFGADTLSEERLLDLERETLITLAHNNETVERMRTLLETGKPLRN